MREAYTAANMYIGRDNMITQLDKMISNLDTNIKEMTPKQTTSNGGWGGSSNRIWLWDIVNFFKSIPKSSDLIFSWASTTNNGGSSQFDTPGGMNTTWQNNSTGWNGTGVFVFPRTPMK